MLCKKYISFFLVTSIFFSSFLPSVAFAQYSLPGIPQIPTDKFPPVPTSDSAIRNKEVGMTILGYTVPKLSWDSIAIAITKRVIEKIVDSTTDWINNGFEGNPVYVTNPERYFTDIADGVAGDFIAGTDLGFLCSPFQQSIRLSLQFNYNQRNINRNPYQCTLTGIKGNIEDFYNDFSTGDWDTWISMTQNPQNNPYGAYISAQAELDSRVQRAVGLADSQLQINRGFLSTRDCITRDPSTGECKEFGDIKTPGSVIEAQLAGVFGTGLNQLELADSFDELINAFMGQLLQKTVFSAKGIFTNNRQSVSGNTPISDPSIPPVLPPGYIDPQDPQAPFNNPPSGNQPLVISCAPETSSTSSNSPVKWLMTITGGSGRLSQVIFSGDEGVSPNTNNVVWPTFDPNIALVINSYQDENNIQRQSSLQNDRTVVNGVNTTTLTLTRVYSGQIGPKTLNITAVDSDSSVQVIQNQQCSQGIYLSS